MTGITGGCQCGRVRYRAGPILGTARCHCTDCQAQSGAGFGLSVYVAPDGFEMSGKTVTYASTADSGNRVDRVFCPNCGVRIAHLPQNRGAYVSLKGGTLDAEHQQPPAMEIWVRSKLPWVDLLPQTPVYRKGFPGLPAAQAAYNAMTTRLLYDARAEYYERSFSRSEPDADLLAFMARVKPGGTVLDLGSGPGNSAKMLAKAGFIAHATDVSAGMVERAAAQPGVTAWQAGFDDLEAVQVYDGIWANFSLLHAPRATIAGHLQRVHRALKPGGCLHMGMKLGEGEGPDSLGRFYAYYSVQELHDLLSDAGFTVTNTREGETEGMTGAIEPYAIILADA